DELVIILDPNTTDPTGRIRQIATQAAAVIIGAVPQLLMYELQFNVPDVATLNTIAALIATMPDVTSVSLSPLLSPAVVPSEWSDPSWNHWNLEMAKTPFAWDITTGILDADFDPGHGDLVNNVD